MKVGAGWRMGSQRKYKKYVPTFSPNTRLHLVNKKKRRRRRKNFGVVFPERKSVKEMTLIPSLPATSPQQVN